MTVEGQTAVRSRAPAEVLIIEGAGISHPKSRTVAKVAVAGPINGSRYIYIYIYMCRVYIYSALYRGLYI